MAANLFFGVDVCKGQWVIAAVKGDGAFYGIWVESCFQDVLTAAQTQGVPLTLVDIPIGLKSAGLDERDCDRQARRRLGKRASSVFRVPVRQAVYAASREQASRVNYECTGKKIGVQSWGIVPRIREVDALLNRNTAMQRTVRETHPEVCFWALNGGKPLMHSKRERSGAGLQERLEIVARFAQGAEEAYEEALRSYPRNRLGADDVLDSMAAAVTAWKCCQTAPCALPSASDPQFDGRGLANGDRVLATFKSTGCATQPAFALRRVRRRQPGSHSIARRGSVSYVCSLAPANCLCHNDIEP